MQNRTKHTGVRPVQVSRAVAQSLPFAYRAIDASMAPRIEPDQVIFSQDRRRTRPFPGFKDLAIVRVADGRVMTRNVSPGSAPGLFDLEACNAKAERDVRLSWVLSVAMIVEPHFLKLMSELEDFRAPRLAARA